MSIGTRICEARKGKYTQAQLAEAIGAHELTVQRWETDKRAPNAKAMLKLAAALGTTVAYLMGETDDPQPQRDSGVNVTTNGDNIMAIGGSGSQNTISVPSENVQRDPSALEKNLLAKGKILAVIYDEPFSMLIARALENEIKRYEQEYGKLPSPIVK
jgi:DNA-binding XRE family transcriptional regulator